MALTAWVSCTTLKPCLTGGAFALTGGCRNLRTFRTPQRGYRHSLFVHSGGSSLNQALHVFVLLDRILYRLLVLCWHHATALVQRPDWTTQATEQRFDVSGSDITHLFLNLLLRSFLHGFHLSPC